MELDQKFNEVVIVDDEEEARAHIVNVLADNAQKFIELESGPQLLRYMDQQPWNWIPDIAFIDLVMPGMSGYDVIRRLRERFGQRHIPLIVVTKMGTGEDIMEAQVAGADAFVKKPATPEKILKALQACRDRKAKKGAGSGNTIPYFL